MLNNRKDIGMKDLYQTLQVSPEASQEEVKRAYRRIALLCHPDRNPSSGGEAEDRFKDANYAYSVLSDRHKRRRYDLYREFVKQSNRWGVPPSPSQERILAELFLDPKLPDLGAWLEEILRARGFSRNGEAFRIFSREALRFFRAVVREEKRRRDARKEKHRPRIGSASRTVLKKVGSTLLPFGAARKGGPGPEKNSASRRAGPLGPGRAGRKREADIEWALPLTREEAEEGTRLTFSFFHDSHWDRLSLRVPAGTREGVRLRVRNKGNRNALSGEAGDLYLRVMIR